MRRTMMGFVAVCGVVAIIALLGGYYLTSLALRPTVQRDEATCYARFTEFYPTLQPWADALRVSEQWRETTLTARDGVTLHGYLLMANEPSERTAVVVHGYTDHPFGMLQIAWIYQHHLGYNVLLPALRFHGKSGGSAIQMGWNDRLDIKRWIAEVSVLFGGEQQIVVHGISMGAAATMMLAGEEDLPASVRCFVEDCGYTSVWEQFKKELKEDYHLPTFPILYAANLMCQWRFGWDFKEASALDAVRRCTRPMLFIHGAEDHYVPTVMAEPLYRAKGGKSEDKELWIAPQSGHAWAFADHPDEYLTRIKNFTSRYL